MPRPAEFILTRFPAWWFWNFLADVQLVIQLQSESADVVLQTFADLFFTRFSLHLLQASLHVIWIIWNFNIVHNCLHWLKTYKMVRKSFHGVLLFDSLVCMKKKVSFVCTCMCTVIDAFICLYNFLHCILIMHTCNYTHPVLQECMIICMYMY